MARSVLLATLITEVRAMGDWQDTDFIPDSEITSFLNDGYTALYDLICRKNQDWFLSSATVSVVSGTASYSLPASFRTLRGVDVLDDQGKWQEMEPFEFADRNLYADASSSKLAARYRVMGDTLRISPTPAWSGSLQVWFIPAPGVLASSGTGTVNTFDGVSGWEKYVKLHAAIACANKEETSPRTWPNDMLLLGDAIAASCSKRDAGRADVVRNVVANRRKRWWDDLPRP